MTLYVMTLFILVSLVTAAVAARYVAPDAWVGIRPALLVAFGIQGAAILTRLGRGHPVSDINHLTVENLRRLNEAVGKVADEQRRAAMVTFSATLVTIGISGIYYLSQEALTSAAQAWPKWSPDPVVGALWVWRILVFTATFLIAAAFCHLPVIVNQDIGLIKLQSQLKKEAVEAAISKAGRERAATEETRQALAEIGAALTKGTSSNAPFGEILNKPPDVDK